MASVSAVISIGSCEKVPLLAPTASTITLVSSRSVLPISGVAQITATVIEQSGTPAHNGTLVTFTTTVGTLEPQEAVTNNGQAVVTLKAGTRSGTAEVVAFSGGARTEAPLMISIGGAAASDLSVTANPATVPSTGGTVTIAASVSDADGNTLAGVPVSFSTTAGTLGARLVNSNTSGEAITTLTTNSAATVTATTGSHSSTVAVEVNTAPTIIVRPGNTPRAGEATTFTVVVTTGTNRIQAATIDFGDGTLLPLGTLTGTTTVSHIYAAAGTYTVVGTATDSAGEQVSVSTVIVVEPAVPLNVNIQASPSPATVDEVVTFTATATGTTVPIAHYTWNFGDGTTVTTSGNVVNHVYSAAGTRSVTVTAVTVDGVSGSTQMTLIVVPLQIEVTLGINPLTANAGQTVSFTATVTPATVVIVRYDWAFGDAAGSTSSTTGRTTTFAYQNADKGFTRTVTVTAVAFDGTTTQTQGLVTINP